MAKAKKKKRGGFLGLLQQSFSGWKKLAKYAVSGKWANDISKAVHRSGAAGRAKERAVGRVLAQSLEEQAAYKAKFERERQKSNKRHGLEAPKPKRPPGKKRQKLDAVESERVKAINRRTAAIKKETKLIAEEAKKTPNQILQEAVKSGAANQKEAVKKAIAKVPTKVPRKGHQRTGTKNGVRDHETTVSKADHQASVAAELLKERGTQKKHAWVKSEYDRLSPNEQKARDIQRDKSNRRQKALKLEALSKDVSQDHIDRAREFLFGAFEDEDDREQIANLTHAQVVKATEKYHDGGWDVFARTAQQDDLEWEKSLEAKRKQ